MLSRNSRAAMGYQMSNVLTLWSLGYTYFRTFPMRVVMSCCDMPFGLRSGQTAFAPGESSCKDGLDALEQARSSRTARSPRDCSRAGRNESGETYGRPMRNCARDVKTTWPWNESRRCWRVRRA